MNVASVAPRDVSVALCCHTMVLCKISWDESVLMCGLAVFIEYCVCVLNAGRMIRSIVNECLAGLSAGVPILSE